jgi:hypothetical protein
VIIDIEKTLNRLADRSKICRSSIEPVLATYGKEAKVGKRILKKAIHERGTTHFLAFFSEALNWPESLVEHFRKMEEHILWGHRYRNQYYWHERVDLVKTMMVAAVLAYAEEMDKP